MARTIRPEGKTLIRSFEGYEPCAYPDPGTGSAPWTVCTGHTGGIKPGDCFSDAQCEQFLNDDLKAFEACVETYCPGLNDWEFSALTSFAFNVGCGALAESTLRRRINAGEDPQVVIPEELPRWVNGANGPLPGLVRRRDAEVKLAQTRLEDADPPSKPGESQQTPQPPSGPAQVKLLDFFKYYSGTPSNPQQEKAVLALESELQEVAPELLESDAWWVEEYRGQHAPPPPPKPEPKPEPSNGIIKLPVTYQCQVDSEYLGGSEALRMCFSSSCAMLLDYIDPEALRGHGQEDDYYLATLEKLGYDSTDAAGQVATLAHFGLDATFRTNGTLNKLRALLADDIPIPCGILHHGHVSNPTGGGHWMCIVGIDENAEQLIIHDPYGELDLINGIYQYTDCEHGRFVRYSFKNWLARWEIVGGDGWYIEAHP